MNMFDWDHLPDDMHGHVEQVSTTSAPPITNYVEIVVRHVTSGDEVVISVGSTATLGDVKEAVAVKLHRRDILKEGRMLQNAGPRSYSSLPDTVPLGTWRRLFLGGVNDLRPRKHSLKQMTLEMALELQADLIAAFSEPQFQGQLKFFKETSGSAKQRFEHIRSVQYAVLPKFGFQGNEDGFCEMMRSLDDLRQNENVADNLKKIDQLLQGVSEMSSPEPVQRTLGAGSCKAQGNRRKTYRAFFPTARWQPPASDGFRLGDYLWTDHAGLESCGKSDFFPRSWFGAVVLPPSKHCGSSSLLLFGGIKSNGISLNDVWRVTVPHLGISRNTKKDGASNVPSWSLVSPHDMGTVNGQGQRTLRKWQGRSDFGYCAAFAGRGGRISQSIIYVAGGVGTRVSFNDIWASDDEGKSWRCMLFDAPWGRRFAPALCAVPGRPHRLVLAGGMASPAEPQKDTWISDDAGMSWTRLQKPPWGITSGRFRSAFLQLPRQPHDEDSESRMLLLGGCFIDGTGGAYGGVERLTHDGWECRLDWTAESKINSATWTIWGEHSNAEGRSGEAARSGVECATATLDPHSNSVVARLPEREFVCVAEARKPQAHLDCIDWVQAPSRQKVDITAPHARDIHVSAAEKLLCVRLIPGRLNEIPRLALVSKHTVLLSGDGEWKRQVRFTLLLGVRLETMLCIPGDLWRGRVLPSLLPAV